MALQLAAQGGADDEARAVAQAAHDLAVAADQKAAEADALAANARQMVLNRDPRLNALESDTVTLKQVAQTVQSLSGESTADRAALHATDTGLRTDLTSAQAAITAVQTALAAEVQARTAADNAEAATRKAADDALAVRVTALETAVAALQQLKVLVGYGVTNLPASLAAGATTNVVVTLSRSMNSSVYSVGYGLAGGTSLLGALQAVGVVTQTATTVTVAVKNTGLTALLNLNTASLSVVAAKDA
jgi:hypothetical protein